MNPLASPTLSASLPPALAVPRIVQLGFEAVMLASISSEHVQNCDDDDPPTPDSTIPPPPASAPPTCIDLPPAAAASIGNMSGREDGESAPLDRIGKSARLAKGEVSIFQPPKVDTLDVSAAALLDNAHLSSFPLTAAAKQAEAVMVALAIPERHLNFAREDLWLGELARDIVAVGGEDQLSFRLMPPDLGRLDVDIEHSGVGVSVRLTAGSPEARTILIEAQPKLVEDIQARGVRVIEAQVASPGSDRHGKEPHSKNRPILIEAAPPESDQPSSPIQPRSSGRFA
jgi:flagellar hook-length control protein FliK